jgi:hypothetical protein
MNWKSTAVVSGASTLLATWVGWTPAPKAVIAPVTPAANHVVDASDIQAQANRLHVGVRTELDYRDPTRNPFRFTPKPAASAARAPQVAVEGSAVLGAPVAPPVPFTLSGMATENVGGAAQRTAILTTATDVLFVKAGDRVGTFTVTRVDETGVEVTDADGSVRRLLLTP